MFIIKFLIYFTVSFLILNFPISKKKIFNHIEGVSDPYAQKVYKAISKQAKEVFSEGAKASKQAFNNTSIKEDVVNNTKSANQGKKPVNLPKDSYTPEERNALLNILKNN